MLNFREYLKEEKTNPVVFSFGRMNPPTIGHEVLVNKVHELAKKHNAHHEIVLSHSQDSEKNPLPVSKKVEHAKNFFPGTNITGASKEQPSLIHHVARLNKEGHDHLIMVAGSDRVPEYHKLLNQYNGKPDKKGNVPFNFKKIDVVSAGQRDPDSEGAEGMSASKMREHARNDNYNQFKAGVPNHVPDHHVRKLYKDVKAGMALKEEMTSSSGEIRGLGMVTGDPAIYGMDWSMLNQSEADTRDQIMNSVKKEIHDKHHHDLDHSREQKIAAFKDMFRSSTK